MTNATRAAEDVLSVSEIVGSLSDTTVGIAIHTSKWRVGKALDRDQRVTMAKAFASDETVVSGRKTLIDTKNEAYRVVNRIIEESYSHWKFQTIPYPQHGVRLINRNALAEFAESFTTYQNKLTIAVDQLEAQLPGLIESQRGKLGQLFRRSDYPQSIVGLYDLSYDLHDINPPTYLAQLNPDLFREQMQRAQDRIQHSISLLENEFMAELQVVVQRIVTGLSTNEDGKRKSVQDSSIQKLNKFFQRFGDLNLNSSGQLNTLVRQAQEVMAGHKITDLRKNDTVRDAVRQQLAAVQTEVDRLLDMRTGRQFDITE